MAHKGYHFKYYKVVFDEKTLNLLNLLSLKYKSKSRSFIIRKAIKTLYNVKYFKHI